KSTAKRGNGMENHQCSRDPIFAPVLLRSCAFLQSRPQRVASLRPLTSLAYRVALVTAPPSYTPRMYHYFPAHMTHPFCYYPSLAPQQARYPPGTFCLNVLFYSFAFYLDFARTLQFPYCLFMRPDETNLYTTLEQTMSSNPNVYFQRGGGVHPGMMY
ncbi:AGAP011645-PA, partial [Anopheles gambiae str. PEST]